MIRRLLLIFVLAISTIVSLVPAGVAEAAPFARGQYRGYFGNPYDDGGGFVLSTGVHPTFNPLSATGRPYVTSFISIINGHRLGPAGRNKTGAAFLILTMLGYPAGTNRAVAQDPAVWNEWVQRVQGYADNYWVDWDVPSAISFNTYWQGEQLSGVESNPDDDAWYDDSGNSTPNAIIFHHPDGTTYRIKKQCANPIGISSPLAAAPYDVDLTASGLTTWNAAELPVSGSGTPADPYKVVSNHKYGVNAIVTNHGPSSSAPGLLQVLRPGGVCAPPGPPGPGGCPVAVNNAHDPSTSVSAQGYEPIWPGWYWNTAVMPDNAWISAYMNFMPTGAVGSTFTLDVYYGPTDLVGTQEHVGLVYAIVSQRTPNVVATNGDIHAGGGVCNTGISSDGTVKGYPGAGSGAQYVVSASVLGGINGVGSNGAGADTLKLGVNGGYTRICRPDLVKAATAYQLVGGYATISGSVDVGTLNPAYEVYYSTGGNLRLHGTVNRKITIVALSGTVEIDGSITRSGAAYAKTAQPSLGIIAAGNIVVHSNVNQVDAYMFSNGIIDTCVEANSTCANPGLLTINGFVMSNTLSLHRLGQRDTNGAVPGERVVLTPQIYLNPPKLFDASIDDILLNGQGEKQPLF